MAAVLCSSFGKLCSGCAEVVVWPCKKGCELCGQSCDLVSDVLCSPFAPYLITTLALNAAPLVYGLRSLTACDDPTWLGVNALLAAGHLLGALYIVYKIQGEDEVIGEATAYVISPDADEKMEKGKAATATTTNDGQPPSDIWNGLHKIVPPPSATPMQRDEQGEMQSTSRAGSMKRMGHVMCHDVGVAVYILVAAFWCVWQLFGISHAVDEGVCSSWVITSLLCGYLYMFLVFCAFGCSMLCLR